MATTTVSLGNSCHCLLCYLQHVSVFGCVFCICIVFQYLFVPVLHFCIKYKYHLTPSWKDVFGSESSDFSAFHQASLQAVQYVLPVLTSAAFKAYLRAKRSRACLEDSYANPLRILTPTWIWIRTACWIAHCAFTMLYSTMLFSIYGLLIMFKAFNSYTLSMTFKLLFYTLL